MTLFMVMLSVAFSAPSNCDPSRDTAPASAEGYCLSEEEYLEFGRLAERINALEAAVASRDAKLEAFEEWKADQDQRFMASLEAVRTEGVIALQQERLNATVALQDARKRSFWEKNGLAVGSAVGSVVTIVGIGVVLETYGDILSRSSSQLSER